MLLAGDNDVLIWLKEKMLAEMLLLLHLELILVEGGSPTLLRRVSSRRVRLPEHLLLLDEVF